MGGPGSGAALISVGCRAGTAPLVAGAAQLPREDVDAERAVRPRPELHETRVALPRAEVARVRGRVAELEPVRTVASDARADTPGDTPGVGDMQRGAVAGEGRVGYEEGRSDGLLTGPHTLPTCDTISLAGA